jgi:cytochrome c oxidase cbb3-type subunit 1
MHPYYIARAFGGLLFLLGAAVGLYNVLMTIRASRIEQVQADGETDIPLVATARAVQPGE